MRKACLILLIVCLLLSCSRFRRAHRVEPQPEATADTKVHPAEPKSVADLTSKWNDTDAQLVAREMIADCLSRAWIPAYVGITRSKPVVTVGPIRNWTGERMDTKTFASHLEKELTNSDKVSFVACRVQWDEIGGEDLNQQEYASLETMKKIRAETGASFILVGAIKLINNETIGEKVVYYQTDLEMLNLKTMAKVWTDSKKIKKRDVKEKS